MTKEDVELVLRVLNEIRTTKNYKVTAENRLFYNDWDRCDRLIDCDFDNLAEAKTACDEFNIICDIFEKPREKVTVYYFTNMNHEHTYRTIKISDAYKDYKKCIDKDGNVNGDLKYLKYN